jgi:hypothetical protein
MAAKSKFSFLGQKVTHYTILSLPLDGCEVAADYLKFCIFVEWSRAIAAIAQAVENVGKSNES